MDELRDKLLTAGGDLRRQSEVRWETSRVELVLKRFNLTPLKSRLYEVGARETRERRMRFADFDALAPDFPLRLVARYCHDALDLSELLLLPALLNRFFDSPPVKYLWEFLDSFGADDRGRPTLLVLNRRGMPGGLAVYEAAARKHLAFRRNDRDDVELIARPAKGRKKAFAVGLAAFPTFLRSMSWVPG